MSEETNNQSETNNIVGKIVEVLVPARLNVVGILIGARKKS